MPNQQIPTPPPAPENNIPMPPPITPAPEKSKKTVIFVITGVLLLLGLGAGGLFLFSRIKPANNINNAEKESLVAEKNKNDNSFVCGKDTVKDADNNSYKTVLVGNQCWMASNLKVGVKLASGATLPADNEMIEKWCFENSDDICITDGGLYSWNEAMQYSTAEKAQGICPAGWHIPTDAEQYALENYLKDMGKTCDANRGTTDANESISYDCSSAGTKLMFGGSSGMNFPIAGYRDTNGFFYYRNVYTVIWSSSGSGTFIWHRVLSPQSDAVARAYPIPEAQNIGVSVRCLKD